MFNNNYSTGQPINIRKGGLLSFGSNQPTTMTMPEQGFKHDGFQQQGGQMMQQPQMMGQPQQMMQQGMPQQSFFDWRGAKPDWQGGGFENRDAFQQARQDWRGMRPNRGFFGG